MTWRQFERRGELNEKNVRNVMTTRLSNFSLIHFLKAIFDLLLCFPLSPQTFRIAPPMCITKPEADFAVEVFRSALIQHMERKAK